MIEITTILNIFSIIFSGLTCIFSLFALYYSMKAWTTCEAMRLSTHTVQYAPVDKDIEKANEEWATKQQENLKKEQQAFAEDIEDEMPEFAPDDEDREIYSF
jgi:hypothetical protein